MMELKLVSSSPTLSCALGEKFIPIKAKIITVKRICLDLRRPMINIPPAKAR